MLFCRKVNRMTKTNQKIPVGWSVKKLGEIGTFVSGGTPDTEKPEYWNGDIVWLTPSEITKLKTRFVSDSERKITKLGLKNSSAVLLPKNSLIICTRATVGDCCINTKEVSTNQGFKNLIPNNNCVDFLYYLISIHKNDLIRRACGSTFLEISKHDIEKLKYVFPPLAEQEKIAEILSCWDEGIEKLSALIEKKKLQKKALMQKLLTAKIRLPGFTDPWKNVKLGDFLIFQTGFPFDSQFFNQDGNGIRLIKNRDLKSDDQMYFYSGNYSTDDIVNDGDILVGMDGDFLPCLWKKGRALLNQRVGRVICKKNLNHIFAYYALSSPLEKIQNKTASTTVKHLSHAGVLEIKTIIPSSLAEQKAIADILSKADAEIELLNKKLAAFNLEKKAMMQKLLTGQIRVKVN